MRAERRRFLLEAYAAGLAAVDGRTLVFDALADCRWPRLSVLAAGKAAPAMMRGALDRLGGRIVEALVVTTERNTDRALKLPRVQQLESSHPVPDARSLAAGAAAIGFVDHSSGPLLVLLSGGSSAMLEQLPADVDIAELERLNHWLLGSGRAIGEMNRVRRAVSLIKGGRLLRWLDGRPTRQLLLSDVPDDQIHVIGSGPLAPPPRPESLPAGLPDWITAMAAAVPPAPAAGDPVTASVHSEMLAGNGEAREAVAAWARDRGAAVHEHGMLSGDVAEAAGRILEYLEQPGLHVWGGEVTVRLPRHPGRGGRCQALAVQVARAIAGRLELCFLAAGTDGRDGPGDDAGALVDGGTIRRAADEGYDAARAIELADSGSFLDAAGDLIHTGPTGTNVTDLYLLWVGE